MSSIFYELGPYYVRRAYRMDSASFWKLHSLLKPYLKGDPSRLRSGSKKKHRNGAKNGLVSTATHLSAAIRYFAGGRPDDIAIVNGISHSQVFVSVWMVVDAVNKCEDLAIRFPECHAKQREIAAGFKLKSDPGFGCCAGCIDGILIWIERPNVLDCELAKCGPMKFHRGHKKKFGLNMQGTCDHEGRFLDEAG